MADVWAPLEFGWSHVYWLTIEGVEYAWTQTATGKTPPSGLTESAQLVVADSAKIGAVVNRERGVGAGFPLSFRLLDSVEVAALMARPTAQTHLTAAATAAGGTLTVADTSAFASSGRVYIGKERIDYSAKTATTFTVASGGRGVAGYAYPHDSRSTSVVTDKPRYWRGRFVTLYAAPIDPTGYVTGATLDADAVVVWRGYLEAEPERAAEGDGFSFRALPLDRMFERPLAGKLTGKVQDVETRFEIASTQCALNITFGDAAGATLATFAIKWDAMPSASVGDLVPVSEFNASAISEFNAAITTYGAGAWINSMEIRQATYTPSDPTFGAFNKGDWVPYLRLAASAAKWIKWSAVWCGNIAQAPNALKPNDTVAVGGAIANNQPMGINVAYSWSPYSLTDGYMQSGGGAKPGLPMIAVSFDGGDPGALPDHGEIEIAGERWFYGGTGSTPTAGTVTLTGLKPKGATAGLQTLPGADVSLTMGDEGALKDLALRMLHSSGESGLRDATYDTLPGRIGYGLPSAMVDQGSFDDVLGDGWLESLTLRAVADDEGLGGVLGGVLGLARLAVSVTDDGVSDAAVAMLHTSAAAGGYAARLTDAEILSHPRASISVKPIDHPNTIEVAIGDGALSLSDGDRVAFEGAQSVEYELPTEDRNVAAPVAAGLALGQIVGDQHAAIMTVDVVPWLRVRIGDAVDVNITHPSVWDWRRSVVGYQGRARCVGRQMDLRRFVQRIDLLIYGQSAGTAICPAAPVTTWAGTAAAPTTIDVPVGFVTEFDRALTANAANLRLLHYRPGAAAEGVAEGYTISSAAVVSGVCRLTVASVIGGAVLSVESYLTFAETASAGAYEQTFAHSGDGSVWL